MRHAAAGRKPASRPWEHLWADDLAAHLRELERSGLAESSLARHVATMRVFFKYLATVGRLPADTGRADPGP